MESLNTAMHLISKNCYFASVDLSDAYYSVPIASEHRKYLRSTWKQQMYEFTCLPNGLACAPRLFTKLMKPVYATLRVQPVLFQFHKLMIHCLYRIPLNIVQKMSTKP